MSEVRRFLRASLRSERRALLRALAWSVPAAAPALASGWCVARALDLVLAGDLPEALAWIGALAGAAAPAAWAVSRSTLELSTAVEGFRDRLVERTVGGALAGTSLDARAATSRLTSQVEIAREAYASQFHAVQRFAVSATAALTGLLGLLPLVLPLVLVPLVAALGAFALLLPRTVAAQRRSLFADEELARQVTASAEGLRDVRACGAERQVAARVELAADEVARCGRQLARLAAGRTLCIALGAWLPPVLLLALAPTLVRRGATDGDVVGAMTYLLAGVHPALQVLVRGVGGTGTWLVVVVRRLLETAPAAEVRVAKALASPSSGALWELEEVTFGYAPGARPVVEGLTLALRPGDHLAVVGPSGAGKSTLAGLLAGLLRPTSGQVLVDGREAAALTPAQLAAVRVLLPQEAYVFSGSLRDNLTWLAPAATGPGVEAVVALLGLTPLVARCGGLDADLRPSGLSAGERQLIALGRAYLSPAPLVVLDESTCHLDAVTERRVESAFARRPGLLVVVAHRLSSALRARTVLVLDGDVACVGSPEGVRESSAAFRRLLGHWEAGGVPRGSQPAGLLRPTDRLDLGAGAELSAHREQVVAHGPR